MKISMVLLKNGIRWFFGLGFVLMSSTYITSNPLAAISALGLAALLIPPLERLVFSKVKAKIPFWGKVVAGIFLVGVIGTNTPRATSNTVAVKSIESSPTVAEVIQSETTKKLDEVVKIIDGDTLQIKIGDKSEVVRLIGIDTPESVDPRKPVQCFANEATKKAKELLPPGRKISLESDLTQGDKDKYNRLLRYVFLEDGSNFGELMIAEGYAHEYTYKVPYKYMEDFKQAEKEAREAERGLWAADACLIEIPPTSKVASPTVTIQPTSVENNPSSGGYTCGTKTKCGEMTSCAEAMYFLNTCGVTRLDGDKDGVPCETLCK